MPRRLAVCLGLAALALGAPLLVNAADWAQWGNTAGRNMVSAEPAMEVDFDPGEFKGNTEEIDPATTRNVKWIAKLGSQSYGNPTISGGMVFIGTNNEGVRDPRYKGDRAVVMALDEKTGNMIWQFPIPKLGTGKVSDWEFLGICSSPAVEGDRLWVVSNRGEVLCMDRRGMANGNDGPYKDEAKYLADKGQQPQELKPTDGDIIWSFDMREELGVFPHNISSSSVLLFKDRVAVATSNGVDWTHTNIPNPRAPALCMLDKNTGELIAEEAEGISARTLHSNWSSPAYGEFGGVGQVLFGGGDGICYAFDTAPVKDSDGLNLFKLLWKVDGNPPHYRVKDGKPLKYATYDGPSEIISTPVVYKDRVYTNIGQDPEHGEGIGNFVCIDPSKRGDITKTGVIWSYDKIHRSLSTPSIADDLIYCGDFSGRIHCIDALTGAPYWVYDTKSHIWGSTLLAAGKLLAGTEDGDIVVLQAGKTMKELARVDMKAPVYSSPVLANGALYIATSTHLYAIGK